MSIRGLFIKPFSHFVTGVGRGGGWRLLGAWAGGGGSLGHVWKVSRTVMPPFKVCFCVTYRRVPAVPSATNCVSGLEQMRLRTDWKRGEKENKKKIGLKMQTLIHN